MFDKNKNCLFSNMCAGVTFLCILMCMVYLLLLNAVCFLSLGVNSLICDACSCKWVCRGSISVSSCMCCMFVSCVQPVAMRSIVFCTV